MTSQTYTAGSDCRIEVDLVDENGLAIDGTSYVWELLNEEGDQIATDVGSLAAGAVTATITVPAAQNTLPAGVRMGGRMLSVVVTDDQGDTHSMGVTYLLRANVFLQVPSESGQTLIQAMIMSQGMPPVLMESFRFSSDAEREAALAEAWARLSKISLDPFRDTDVPDSALSEEILSRSFAVNEISKADWDLLPEHFRTACRRAQIIEATVLLGGDPTWENRENGLLSKSVGESSEMFRSRPPAPSALSPKARREVAAYINSNVIVRRA